MIATAVLLGAFLLAALVVLIVFLLIPLLQARAVRSRLRALKTNRRPKPSAIAWLIP